MRLKPRSIFWISLLAAASAAYFILPGAHQSLASWDDAEPPPEDCSIYEQNMIYARDLYENYDVIYKELMEKYEKAKDIIEQLWPIVQDKNTVDQQVSELEGKLDTLKEQLDKEMINFFNFSKAILDLISAFSGDEEPTTIESFCSVATTTYECNEWSNSSRSIESLQKNIDDCRTELAIWKEKQSSINFALIEYQAAEWTIEDFARFPLIETVKEEYERLKTIFEDCLGGHNE